jgi:putative spermidine/putrescine transport system permease protein
LTRADRGEVGLRAVIGAISGAALTLLLAPTLVVVIVSFTSGFSLKFPPPGYPLRWYSALADAWQLQFAARNSIEIAVVTTF